MLRTHSVRADPSPERCETLNIEAAVVAPDAEGDGRGRLWLGLRNPRVGENAILLRVFTATNELRFDAVQLLDTGGRGLRALDISETSLFGIAAGEATSGILFRSSLPTPGGNGPTETLVAGLPSGAEGLGASALERQACSRLEEPGPPWTRCLARMSTRERVGRLHPRFC